MTFRRDLKRRIRERQKKTGESYTTARAQMIGEHGRSSLLVELHDVTEEAKAVGFACEVRALGALCRSRKQTRQLLEQLKQILLAPIDGIEALKRAVLLGEPLPARTAIDLVTHARSFLQSLRLGIRGLGAGGRIIAFDAQVDGETAVITAQLLPRHTGQPLLVLSRFRAERESAGVLLDSLGLLSLSLRSPR
jgi:hypothetical protein